MKDVRSTIISRYAVSERIVTLIDLINSEISIDSFKDTFIKDILNIKTANSWGLDNWGRILNVPRLVYIPQSSSKSFTGYKTKTDPQSWQPFNQAIFYTPFADKGSYYINDDAYRMILLFKAAVNISNGTIPTINRLLQWYFTDRGKPFVVRTDRVGLKGFNLRYVFDFYLEEWEKAVFKLPGMLPTPAGVGQSIFQFNMGKTFGFYVENTTNQPHCGFNQGPFTQGVFYV